MYQFGHHPKVNFFRKQKENISTAEEGGRGLRILATSWNKETDSIAQLSSEKYQNQPETNQ